MAESWENELVEGLIEAGNKNFELTGDDARKTAMENIAAPIAKAIKNGRALEIKGSATVAEINNLLDIEDGDIYAVSDSGIIRNSDGTTLKVSAGDLVIYQDGSWQTLLHIDLSGYATTKSLTAHTTNQNNPHSVTAEQVGAYTKDESDITYETKVDAQSKTESYGILMRANGTNTLQFYRPSIIVIPDPIYEFPQTTFTGNSRVTTNYALLDAEGSTATGAMDKWTLFFDITADIGGNRLINNSSQYAKTSTASDKVIEICGGRWNGATAYLVSYWWVGSTSAYFKGVIQMSLGRPQGCGKAAYRRDSDKSQYLQYTIDGKLWYDLDQRVDDLSRLSDGPYLTIGGAYNNYGTGTISAKLWNVALNDISSLFN